MNEKTDHLIFPFMDLLGLKKKERLTPEQEFGKKLLKIAEKHNRDRKRET